MYTFQNLMISLSAILLVLLFLGLQRWHAAASSAGRKKLPPSPRKLPIIGNLHQVGTFPHRSLQSLSRRYGPLMLIHFGKVPVVVVSSADAAREIMKHQDLIFCSRPKLSLPDRLLFGSKDMAFSPYGEYWRQMRSLCVMHLLSSKRVESFRHVREQETSLMVDNIRRLGCSSPAVNLSDVLVGVTNDVVCRIALGRKYSGDGEGEEVKKFLGKLLELLGSSPLEEYIPWLAWVDRLDGMEAKIVKVAAFFNDFLAGVLEEHRDETKRGKLLEDSDFVDILLEFQRGNKSSTPVEDDTVKALIMDMFAAGTDTTSSALEWTMAELIKNPKSMEMLQNEVREVGGSKEEIEEEDLEKMPYLKAVMKESLRLHAPVPLLVPRESTQDTKLLGYDITARTRVMVNAWAIGRDPSVWETPDEFRPERFLHSRIDFKGLHFDLIPFGAGRRGCPGIAFAMSVDELALAKLVHNFDFALPNGQRMEDLDVSEASGISVRKKLPLLVVPTPHA